MDMSTIGYTTSRGVVNTPTLPISQKDSESASMTLLRTLWKGGAWGMLWTPNGGEGNKNLSQWFQQSSNLFVPSGWRNKNVFFGVNPAAVKRGEWQATTTDTISCINALYAEWDGKDYTEPTEEDVESAYEKLRLNPANKAVKNEKLWEQAKDVARGVVFVQDMAGYKELCLNHILSLNPAPSVLWDSGGGYQGVWLLDTTETIDSETKRNELSSIQSRWAKSVGADSGVCDLRRVLRLPGSTNFKKRYAPDFPVSEFVYTHYDQRYPLSALVECMPVVEVEAHDASVIRETTENPDLIISYVNSALSVREMLLRYGCTKAEGNRLARPGDPGNAGIIIDEKKNRSIHWSTHDTLFSEKSKSPYDVWVAYAFEGDSKAAYELLKLRLYEGLRLWLRTTNFYDLMPEDSRPDVYRTDGTDTKIADGVIDLMVHAGKMGVVIGKHRLGKQAGVSANTAQASMQRLSGWLFEITDSEKGGTHVSFAKSFRESFIAPLLESIIEAGSGAWETYQNEYSGRKADEPFLSGTSQFVKRKAQGMADAQGETNWTDKLAGIQAQYGDAGFSIVSYLRKHGSARANTLSDTCGASDDSLDQLLCDRILSKSDTGIYGLADEFTASLIVDPSEVLRDHFFGALGETGIRILDALSRCGEMEVSELATETGKKVSGLRGSLRKLEERGLVLAEREKATDPKVYMLADNIWEKLEEMAPRMKTFTIASQRENLRLRDNQRWAMKAKKGASAEQVVQIDKKIERMASKRMPHLARIFADLGLSDSALRELASDENKMARLHGVNQPVAPHPAKVHKLERLHGQSRIEQSAQRQIEAGEAQARLYEIAQKLQSDGVPRWDWYRNLTLAGYTGEEVGRFLHDTKVAK